MRFLKTRQKGTRGVEQVANLTALDRCDRCSAAAGAVIVLPSARELLMCVHHTNKFESGFPAGTTVYRKES